MIKRILSILIVVVGVSGIQAAIPDGYYDDAIGLSGEELQQALATIINHTDPGYSSLWTIYQSTDLRSDGKIWDMYSATSNFTYGSDQCGTYSSEGDCYNREHSIPKSWVKGSEYSDIHMVVPSDGYINGRRGNYPFGEVGSSTYVSDNSFSKVGTCSTSGYSGTVFEPNDEYKGDFARIYFYAATRYCNVISSWDNGENIFTTSFPHLTSWHKAMMLRWHELDPVSQKEIDRNDAIYASKQKNRNPFVDYPELVDLIFGSNTTTAFNPDGGTVATPYITTPVDGDALSFGSVQEGTTMTQTLTVKGGDLTKDISLSITGSNSSYFDVSVSSLSATAVESGTYVTITYTPTETGTHMATLVLAGGGLSSQVNVSLTGTAIAVDDPVPFEALAATVVGNVSFVANWTEHAEATDYELYVWEQTGESGGSTTLFDVSFSSGAPSGWSTSGYTNVESSSLRMASSSKDGVVESPAVNLSSGGDLTVTCKPYNKDASVLYVSIDDEQVATIDCSAGEVTQTVTLPAATSSSTVTLKALSGKRVYLYSAKLTTGGAGESWTLLDDYPTTVGNIVSHTVENLSALTTYRYQVIALSGSTELAVSDYITVTTIDDDFRALDESELTNVSFVANWTAHSQASGYELSVWKKELGVMSTQTLFDVSFSTGTPSGWSTDGYTGVENSSIRLASGSNDGAVISPSVDLSNGGELTVTCAPYKTSDNSVLYVLVDGVEVAQIDCASEQVTQTVALVAATSSSKITLKAAKSHRVYLYAATLTTSAGSDEWIILDNYSSRNVGNVTSYKVENLDITTTYRYRVTAIDEDNNELGTSDYIELTTYELATGIERTDIAEIYVYAYSGVIYIDDAPANARVNVYNVGGTLCAVRTTHAVREAISLGTRGVYIVQIITDNNSYTKRVAVK